MKRADPSGFAAELALGPTGRTVPVLTGLVALSCALVTAVLGMVLLDRALGRLDHAIAADRDAVYRMASAGVESSLSRALTLGIPADRLVGVDAFLEALRQRLPGTERIVLVLPGQQYTSRRGDGEQTAHAPEPESEPSRYALSLPLSSPREGATGGTLLFWHAASPLAGDRPGLLAGVAALSLGAGGVGGGLFFLCAGRALRTRGQRLAAAVAAVGQGQFVLPPPGGGTLPPDRCLKTLAEQIAPLTLRHALLMSHAEGLRAIDHDGSLTRQVEEILAALPAEWEFSAAETDLYRQGR